MDSNIFEFDVVSKDIISDDSNIDLDFSFFMSDKAEKIDDSSAIEKPKKTRKAKEHVETTTGMVPARPEAHDISDVDYGRTYNETSNLLRGAIAQADELSTEIKGDIDAVRGSKTLKNKYSYITDLTSSAGTLLSTKISAIKELNSTITQVHNLELNRAKALKLDQQAQNDESRMMDIYSAFVNTPIGTYTPQAPSLADINLGANGMQPTINPVEMIAPGGEAHSNLSPEQIRMRMESNPNIQAVVRYNQTTGQRCFDVIDKSTGASVPNYPRPDAFLLEDTTIDVNAGIARNRNINEVWPLVLDGSNGNITEY